MQTILRYITVLSFLPLGLAVDAKHASAQATCEADVIVQSGDTMSSIAGQYYGDAQAYTRIFDATNLSADSDATYTAISNVNLLEVGWKLCIPGPLNESSTANIVLNPPSAASAITGGTATANSEATIESAQPQAAAVVSAPEAPVIDLPLDEMHPLMIEYMRQQAYPGSEIIIEEELEAGINYRRYVTSYQSDGNKIFSLLTVPNGVAPQTGWPAIIFNHGYIPPEIYRTTERYVAYQDAFARNGYITFKADYRGHGFSEGESASGSGSPAYTIDVLNALASVQGYPGVDVDRIGMWGHSMGGSITLRSMVISDDIKVGVIWAGTVGTMEQLFERWERRRLENPPTEASTGNSSRRRWREELIETYGSLEENPEFWASISPNSYVADLSGPILLQHATGDATVPVAFSQVLNQQILAVGGDVEYIEYQGDDHNISVNLSAALSSAVAYFDRYLK